MYNAHTSCNDAREFVARIDEANDDIERNARREAYANHVRECATCQRDAQREEHDIC